MLTISATRNATVGRAFVNPFDSLSASAQAVSNSPATNSSTHATAHLQSVVIDMEAEPSPSRAAAAGLQPPGYPPRRSGQTHAMRMPDAAGGRSPTRRVVVGVDRSLSARVALEHAARRTGGDGRLIVASVIPPLTDAVSRAMSELDDGRRAMAQELVDRLAGDAGVPTEQQVVEGAPAERLAELAREDDADEIVVGSRGMGRFAAALGSVSHALLAQADRPVVVVPQAAANHPREGRPHGRCTVVVGYDGSPPARAALEYAAQRAKDGGRVVVVHAFHPTPDWLGSPYYQRALDASQSHGEDLLRSLEEQDDLGVELGTTLVEGPPARAIVAAADARDADEIVVGSRGFGRVRGVLGSVSHAVLHEADRPVVVIPADAAQA
jgi:nucleotide-binding universal stress UspA family protein